MTADREPVQALPAVAVVSGAARGIGYACARWFARRGVSVVMVDRLRDELLSSAETLRADTDAPVHCETMDLLGGDFDAVVAAVDTAPPGPAALVNIAGTTRYGTAGSTTPEELETSFRENVSVTHRTVQALRPSLAARPGSSITNMASAAAVTPVTGFYGYSIAKAGVIEMTRHMALEFADDAIRVNAVAPGPVETEMLKQHQDAAIRRALLERIPLGRYASVDDVAALIGLLSSPDTAYVTGQVLATDGGLTISGPELHRRPADS